MIAADTVVVPERGPREWLWLEVFNHYGNLRAGCRRGRVTLRGDPEGYSGQNRERAEHDTYAILDGLTTRETPLQPRGE
jgi:hypothetical protein